MISEELLNGYDAPPLAPVTQLPSAWKLGVKRTIDLLAGGAALILTFPVIVLLALAIYAQDGANPIIRQVRVGRHGKPFTMLKLRTMVPNAESRFGEVAALNQRELPLYKASFDPRVTRIGRILRASSLDELPQLVNVMQGTMSLVGPRPALPYERERFDSELRLREMLLPGITGLWQVEARDHPSFSSYRELDLHYLKNWSLSLDVSIMLATPGAVVLRAAAAGRRRLGA